MGFSELLNVDTDTASLTSHDYFIGLIRYAMVLGSRVHAKIYRGFVDYDKTVSFIPHIWNDTGYFYRPGASYWP